MRRLIFCFALFLPAQRLYAQAADAGLAGSFMRLGTGARALSMGGAYAGIADDITALYWNPAGLANIGKMDLGVTSIILPENTSSNFAGFALPTDKSRYGVFAAGLLEENSGGFQGQLNPFDAPTSFSISNDLFMAGWGMHFQNLKYLPGTLNVGGTGKVIQQKIGSANSSSWGADLGVQYQPIPEVSIGLTGQNLIAPVENFSGVPVPDAKTYSLVPSYQKDLNSELRMTVAGGLEYAAGVFERFIGCEFLYDQIVAFRGGLDSQGMTAGVGFRYDDFQVDYAVIFNQIAPSQIISLDVRFGKTAAEIEAEKEALLKNLSQSRAKRAAHDYYLEASESEKSGDYSKAARDLDAASALDPDNPEIEKKRAEVDAELKTQMRLRSIEEARSLALGQYRQGNLISSLQYWKQIQNLDPKDAEAKAYVLKIENSFGKEEKKRLAEALAEAQKRKELERLARAGGLLVEGKYDEAILEAKKVLKDDPAQADAQRIVKAAGEKLKSRTGEILSSALADFNSKKYRNAIELFERALKADPKNKEALEKIKIAKTALRYETSPEEKKTLERLYYDAVNLYLKGDYPACGEILKKIFDLDPVNEDAKKLKAKLDAVMPGQ